MQAWLGLARTAALTTMLAGCYGAHGAAGEEDAGGGLPPDPPAADAGLVVPPVPRCGGEGRVEVAVEQVGLRACGPGRYDEAALYAVEPEGGALRLRLDLCPNADDDCRCDVTVRGVREGLHAELAAPSGAVTVQLGQNGVAIEQPADCEPAPEPVGCVSTLYFAAMDGLVASPPIDPDALDVRVGEPTCSRSAPELGEACSASVMELVVTAWVSGFPGAIGTEQIVGEGEIVPLDSGAGVFHAIRTSVVSCPDARVAPTAAWAAWLPAR